MKKCLFIIIAFAIIISSVTAQAAAESQTNPSQSSKWSKTGKFASALGQSSLASGRSMFDLLNSREELYQKRLEGKRKMIDLFGGYLPGSTEFWVDTVCSTNIPKVGNGYAFVDQGDTLAIVAHIAGERLDITEFVENAETGNMEEKTKYIYKIEGFVQNNDPIKEDLGVNIYLDAQPIFSKKVQVKPNGALQLAGRDTFVQDSEKLYFEVCLKFDDDIEVRDGDKYEKIDKICNSIVPSIGILPSPYSPPLPQGLLNQIRGGSSTPGIPSAGDSGLAINDI